MDWRDAQLTCGFIYVLHKDRDFGFGFSITVTSLV